MTLMKAIRACLDKTNWNVDEAVQRLKQSCKEKPKTELTVKQKEERYLACAKIASEYDAMVSSFRTAKCTLFEAPLTNYYLLIRRTYKIVWCAQTGPWMRLCNG